jgi:hypothetical protein
MSTNRTWHGSPTKLDDGTWGVSIDTSQVESWSELEPCGTNSYTHYSAEPSVGDKVKITTSKGKSWWTTIAGGGELVRGPYGAYWKCETPATKKAQAKMSPEERERKINAAADRRYNRRKRRRQMMAELYWGG